MPWQGIWFEPEAREGGPRDPELLQAFGDALTFPYPRNFIETEEERLRRSRDPGRIVREGERRTVYYSLGHDGGKSGANEQGCQILRWLFGRFRPDGSDTISARFSEIPVIIHEPDPVKSAALGNALTLLRFLGAREDQAVARIALIPWDPRRIQPGLAAADYERRIFSFLNESDLFYPDDVDLFDVLGREDFRSQRSLPPCCNDRIGFVRPLLEWVDDCWPETPEERRELEGKLRRSLADEAAYVARHGSRYAR